MSERSEQRMRNSELLRVVRQVRLRWRFKVILRGLAIMGAVGAVAFLFSAYGMEAFQFTPESVTAFRVATYAALALLFVRFLAMPLSRQVSEDRVALYLEENEPELEARVLSALEVARAEERGAAPAAPALSPSLARGVVESAIERCREIDYGRRIERSSFQRSGGVLAASVVTALLLFLFGPNYLRHGARALLSPTRDAADASPYSFLVDPGDITVARGSDQVVSAELQGFQAEEVDVLWRRGEATTFEPLPMIETPEGSYEVLLLDLDEPTEYFVRSGGVRSAVFRIDVADLPTVERIELEYVFPRFTGLPPRIVENGGDIAAVRGTVVKLKVVPTMGVPGGNLILVQDDSSAVPLELAKDGTLVGAIEVEGDGFYQVELGRPDGTPVTGSPLYTIDVLEDQPPSVSFTKPGRDSKASAIEEIFVEVRADDDFGVGSLTLAFSVNGSDEERVRLFSQSGAPLREVSAGHTFFLEEYGLEPGDVVAYFAEAQDNRADTDRTVTSDIYFLEIRPFRTDVRQADNRGQPQGGGQGGPETLLSKRQREITAGTFNLERDRERYSDQEFRDNLTLLVTAQGQLREQVQTLLQRMSTRGQISGDARFTQMSEALTEAGKAMEKAEEQLQAREVKQALGPEQQALQHLLRAEEVFNEVQVGAQGGGGGAGGDPAVEDLVDLYELELDKLRNQYETVQRGRQDQVDNQLDETMERLRELARRQQQELERQRRQAANLPGSQSGGGGSQRQLAEETEEAARQLERLARQNRDQEMMETARRLQEAADAMRQSAANPGNAGAGEAGKALDRLEEARRLLDRTRSDRLEGSLDDALERARDLARRQKEMTDQVKDLPTTAGAARTQDVQRIWAQKDQMERELADLERQLDELSADSRQEQRDASVRMREAADDIRDEKMKEKVRYSKSLVQGRAPDFAGQFEEQIQEDLERLAERIGEARSALSESGDDQTADALDRTRDLLRGLESMEQRMREAREGQQTEQEGEQADGQEGQPGQEGQGQDGERSGEGGQEGQRGRQGQEGDRRLGQPDDRFGAGGSQAGRFSPEAARQFQREMQERLEEAEALDRDLREAGLEVGDLREIISAMRRMDDARTYADAEEVARLQANLVEDVKRLEYALRRAVEGAGAERLYLSGSDEVPEGFRELVEEYYRSLAREAGGG